MIDEPPTYPIQQPAQTVHSGLCTECGGEAPCSRNEEGDPDWYCVACGNTGIEGQVRCARCGLRDDEWCFSADDGELAFPWDVCACTEEEISTWQLTDCGPEVSRAVWNIAAWADERDKATDGTMDDLLREQEAFVERVEWAAQRLRWVMVDLESTESTAALAELADRLKSFIARQAAEDVMPMSGPIEEQDRLGCDELPF